VGAAQVSIAAAGCELLPPEGPVTTGDRHGDVMALGALIFEVLTDTKPFVGAPPPAVRRVTGPRTSPAALRAGALRVGVRCLSGPAQPPRDIAKVAAQLRLLALLARHTQPAVKPRPAGGRVARSLGVADPPASIQPVSVDAPDFPGYRRCPGCYSDDVHASRPRTRGEKLAAVAFQIPLYRCHQCSHRWLLLWRVPIACKMQKAHRRTY
jgi:hypothetical protein